MTLQCNVPDMEKCAGVLTVAAGIALVTVVGCAKQSVERSEPVPLVPIEFIRRAPSTYSQLVSHLLFGFIAVHSLVVQCLSVSPIGSRRAPITVQVTFTVTVTSLLSLRWQQSASSKKNRSAAGERLVQQQASS